MAIVHHDRRHGDVALGIPGGSFDAGRTLESMLVSSQFPPRWVYIISPTLDGALGALCYDY